MKHTKIARELAFNAAANAVEILLHLPLHWPSSHSVLSVERDRLNELAAQLAEMETNPPRSFWGTATLGCARDDWETVCAGLAHALCSSSPAMLENRQSAGDWAAFTLKRIVTLNR